MNKLSTEKRAQIIGCLVEGMSIRSTVRITGAAKNTVTKLLVDLGAACAEYQDEALRGLECRRIECDEIWSFCYAKKKNVPDEFQGMFGYGDVWTWTAICTDSKLVPSWLVANRTPDAANIFMQDLASRMNHRIQLTTDGYRAYAEAVEGAFGADVDYAMLVKMYGNDKQETPEKKYSPSRYTGAKRITISGNPSRGKISTSAAERNNLTMRMSMRRFTRLTNGFSKKVANLEAAVALHFMYYNFARIHKSLRVTPAMEAGISDHVWTLEDIAGLLD
jgi:IS1 family transposase